MAADGWFSYFQDAIRCLQNAFVVVASGLCPGGVVENSSLSGHRPDTTTYRSGVLQRSLFGLCVRGRRGGGSMIRGLFRRRGRAMGGFRGAAGYESKVYNSKTGEDNVFHKYVCCLVIFLVKRG